MASGEWCVVSVLVVIYSGRGDRGDRGDGPDSGRVGGGSGDGPCYGHISARQATPIIKPR